MAWTDEGRRQEAMIEVLLREAGRMVRLIVADRARPGEQPVEHHVEVEAVASPWPVPEGRRAFCAAVVGHEYVYLPNVRRERVVYPLHDVLMLTEEERPHPATGRLGRIVYDFYPWPA